MPNAFDFWPISHIRQQFQTGCGIYHILGSSPISFPLSHGSQTDALISRQRQHNFSLARFLYALKLIHKFYVGHWTRLLWGGGESGDGGTFETLAYPKGQVDYCE